jgi:hypothetical protein
MQEFKNERVYHLPISELIDRLSILEIKLVLHSSNSADFLEELKLLKNDIQLELELKKTYLDTNLVQVLISLGQMNLHIWYIKERMKTQLDHPEEYAANMKLAHQLNGLRNQLKNSLLGLEGASNTAKVRSNIELDGLELDLGL